MAKCLAEAEAGKPNRSMNLDVGIRQQRSPSEAVQASGIHFLTQSSASRSPEGLFALGRGTLNFKSNRYLGPYQGTEGLLKSRFQEMYLALVHGMQLLRSWHSLTRTPGASARTHMQSEALFLPI